MDARDIENIMQLRQQLPEYPGQTEDRCMSALDAIDLEALDALCYNNLYGDDGKFDGHRYLRFVETVNGFAVVRVFLTSYYRDQNPDGLIHDEDGNYMYDEDGCVIVDDSDDLYFPERNYGEVAQVWFSPNGERLNMQVQRDQEYRMRDVNGCWTLGSEWQIAESAKDIDEALCDNYSCYDEHERDEYGTLVCNTAFMAMQKFMHLYEFLKSGRVEYAEVCRVALRHNYLHVNSDIWFQMLDNIKFCGGNLNDVRLTEPKNFEEAWVFWNNAKQHKIEKIEAQHKRELKRKADIEWEQKMISQPEWVAQKNAEYLRDKGKYLNVAFCNDTMEFRVLQNMQEIYEEGMVQDFCLFRNAVYAKDDVVIFTVRDKQTGERLSTLSVYASTGEILYNLTYKNHTPKEATKIAATFKDNAYRLKLLTA